MKTYTHLHMEAATCLWEAMLEANNSNKLGPFFVEDLNTAWEGHGTVHMRHAAIDLAGLVLKTWDVMSEYEQQQCVPYDWDFVPRFLSKVTWENGVPVTLQDPREMANLILGKPVGTVKAPRGWDVAG